MQSSAETRLHLYLFLKVDIGVIAAHTRNMNISPVLDRRFAGGTLELVAEEIRAKTGCMDPAAGAGLNLKDTST